MSEKKILESIPDKSVHIPNKVRVPTFAKWGRTKERVESELTILDRRIEQIPDPLLRSAAELVIGALYGLCGDWVIQIQDNDEGTLQLPGRAADPESEQGTHLPYVVHLPYGTKIEDVVPYININPYVPNPKNKKR